MTEKKLSAGLVTKRITENLHTQYYWAVVGNRSSCRTLLGGLFIEKKKKELRVRKGGGVNPL